MPFTLQQYMDSSERAVSGMVADEFRKNSYLLDNMTFDDGANLNAGGTAWTYVYDRITTEPTATARAVNTEYTAQEAVTTAVTTNLKIFGGSFEVDRTQLNTARYGDRIAFQMQQKTKATGAAFNDYFINGDSGTSALQFDGLARLLSGTESEATAATDISTAANVKTNYLAFLDEMYGWLANLTAMPDILIMNRQMKARLRTLAQAAGYYTESEDAFGRKIWQFDGMPIIDLGDKPGTSSPIVPTVAGTPDTTSIYAIRLGLDAVHGISPSDGERFINGYLPDLMLPGAVKKGEVEMVSAIAIKNRRAAGVLKGIKVAP